MWHWSSSSALPRCILARFLILAIAAVAWPSVSSASTGNYGASFDLQRTFLAGAYLDPATSRRSHLVRYLLDPAASDGDGPLAGNELTPIVRGVLRDMAPSLGALRLDLNGLDGHPVAFFLSRAQHETALLDLPPPAGRHFTVLSLSLSFDVLTDQAAFEQTRRLESVYSRMRVIERVVESEGELGEAELRRHYRAMFEQAVREVSLAALGEISARRARAQAVFQLDGFSLPAPQDDAIRGLLDRAAAARAVPSDGDPAVARREEDALKRELLHLVHQFTHQELQRRGIADIALLPPPGPWTEGRVARLLKDRLSFLDDEPVVTRVDVEQMNGYHIRAALLQSGTRELERNRLASSRLFGARLASRIYRPRHGDPTALHVPSRISEPSAKTAIGDGGEAYLAVVGLERPATRDITLGAVRRAAEAMAAPLVDLLLLTRDEINQ